MIFTIIKKKKNLQLFEELADVRWMMYLWGTTGAIAFFVFSIIITHVTNKTI